LRRKVSALRGKSRQAWVAVAGYPAQAKKPLNFSKLWKLEKEKMIQLVTLL